MKVLITGAGGQLGSALTECRPSDIELHALRRTDLDITDRAAVSEKLRDLGPSVVINTAAFTQVDQAESEPRDAERANALGPANLATECAREGVHLIHISTDYVFDGTQTIPYAPESMPNPINVYGRTKLSGELAVRQRLPGGSMVVRTSWLYKLGHGNFLTTMLRLMASEPEISVVDDHFGAPTSATALARVLWALTRKPHARILHWCNAGGVSWYEYAVAIAETARVLGILSASPRIRPIPSRSYVRPAQRPAYSVLDSRATDEMLQIEPQNWKVALFEELQKYDSARGTDSCQRS